MTEHVGVKSFEIENYEKRNKKKGQLSDEQ
jgi:hypothetical protein